MECASSTYHIQDMELVQRSNASLWITLPAALALGLFMSGKTGSTDSKKA